jgi:hypothetical protein
VIATSPFHWRADCCLATSSKHSSYCWVRLSEKVVISPLPSYTRYIMFWCSRLWCTVHSICYCSRWNFARKRSRRGGDAYLFIHLPHTKLGCFQSRPWQVELTISLCIVSRMPFGLGRSGYLRRVSIWCLPAGWVFVFGLDRKWLVGLSPIRLVLLEI